MAFIARDPSQHNTPPGWGEVDAHLGAYRPVADLGLSGEPGDVNRFRSRYRLAKSFTGVQVAGFTPDTVRGYSELFRVFLVWSAFEQLLRILAESRASIEKHLGPYGPQDFECAIRSVEDYRGFLTAVQRELDRKPLQDQMLAFLEGRECNILIVPAAIRHIFAHGKLTPHSGVGNVEAACSVAARVCEFLFRIIDGEFIRRLRDNGLRV